MTAVLCVPLLRRAAGALMAAGLMLAAATLPAEAQTAATQYQTLQTRESRLRTESPLSLTSVRRLAGAYEDIVRLWPRSGYADNALWQASGLLQLAADHGGADRDRTGAVRLLTLLKREYPTSSLVVQADARLRELAPKTTASSSAARTAVGRAAVPPTTSPRPAATSAPTPGGTKPALSGAPTTAPAASTMGPVPAAARTPAAELRSISRSALPKGDRIVIEFSAETSFASSRSLSPDQLQFTFAGAAVAPRTIVSAASVQGPLAKTVRVGSPTAGTVVLAIDLAGSPRFSTFPLYDPYRLVIDIEADPSARVQPPTAAAATPLSATLKASAPDSKTGASTKPVADTKPAADSKTTTDTKATPTVKSTTDGKPGSDTKPAAAASTSRGDYSLARQLGLGVARVVIDAGHGGHDPGAQANGVTEAELVLDVALRTEALLEDQPGFDVVLTRRTNEFIPLEERTAITNREHADLFLSIHANSSPQAGTRGIETYLLNFAETPQAEAVAARENAATAKTMNLLPQIVRAITLNNKLEESREFAGMVQQSLVRRIRTQNQDVQDLGVKQAPFMVLIGAQMPSVLAEISFITNREDASLLKQPAYRQKIAQALADAVLKYQASLKKATAVAATR